MPQSFQNNFTSGEVTPLMGAKVDLAKYYNGCALLENMLILPFGGVVKRGGSQYIAEPKYYNKTALLVRFEYSSEQAYVLEFGHQYIRFFKDQAPIMDNGAPYEIASPYEENDLNDLYIETQSVDVLYITHGKYETRKLMRLGHTNWRLEKIYVNYNHKPTVLDTYKPALTLTPAAITGTGITFTASAAVFLPGDVGRYINYGVCRAEIKAYTDATHVTADILIDFPNTNPIAAGDWSLSGPSSAIVAYTPNDGTNMWYAEGTVRTFTTDISAFRAADQGKYFRILGGLIYIKTFTDAQTVSGEIIRELPQLTTSLVVKAGNLLLESAAWGADNYPRTSGLMGNRLLFGGSPQYPQTIWGSRVGDFEDLAGGSKADDPWAFTISSGQANVIRWLAALRELFIGTNNGEWRLSGGSNGEAINPGNPPLVSQESVNGVINLPPMIIGRSVIYADRFAQTLYIINYKYQNDAYVSDNLNLLSPDILKSGIVGLAFAPKKYPTIWAPRSDGILASLTIMPEHEVQAWSRQITDGQVERVCTIPGAAETETWLLVKRGIGGQTKRYIELLKSYDYGDDLKDAWFVDCGLQFINTGAPVTTLSNLGHLEGKTVAVFVDGKKQADKLVANGQITLDLPCVYQAVAGLGYTAKLRTLNLNLPSMNQQGYTKRVHEVVMRLYRAIGGKVGPDADHLENINPGLTDESSGDKIVKYRGGWETDAQIYIEHSDPTPFNVLALMTRFEQGEK